MGSGVSQWSKRRNNKRRKPMTNLPTAWFTVKDPQTYKEYGPFKTHAQAFEFAQFNGGGCIHEYRNMRLRETREITREEYEAMKDEPGVLIDPADADQGRSDSTN